MTDELTQYFQATAEVLSNLASDPPEELDRLVGAILTAWDRGGKVVSCGNGGSASDSQHFVTELVARFNTEPIHKPAICLTANSPVLTAVSNDWSFEEVFSRQLEANLTPEDVFLGISTSGTSANVLAALNKAAEIGAECYVLTGNPPTKLKDLACTVIGVPSDHTPRIQEAHTACLHYVCQELDRKLQHN